MKVYVARGTPGQGKDFEINKMIQDKFLQKHEYVICSADHYFLDAKGVYNFDKNLLGNAHGACHRKFKEALAHGIPHVFVSNCNISYKDCRYYIENGALEGYEIYLVEGKAPWRDNVKECAKRNQHNVPEEVIRSMKEKYQSNETVARFALENLGVTVHYQTEELP